eukprot:TRINITY_DN19465_c1_g1_i2.p1 TRINITY_DN19465_c1_g1~~TRINITY_DN19465_c1_g1_i2.p1  ORF type:complete len:433 (-),score=62.22 TRINITY_DN19465_c1_g1_i2:33-1256(-)
MAAPYVKSRRHIRERCHSRNRSDRARRRSRDRCDGRNAPPSQRSVAALGCSFRRGRQEDDRSCDLFKDELNHSQLWALRACATAAASGNADVTVVVAMSAIPWTCLPAEVWEMVADALADAEVIACSSVSRGLRRPFTCCAQWDRRAARTWVQLSVLPAHERQLLLIDGSLASEAGARGYIARRVLLRGQAVKLLAGRTEVLALSELVRLCGGNVSSRSGPCDMALVGRRGAALRSARAVTRSASEVYTASWLVASLLCGRRLPAHRRGCAAAGSPFSLPHCCIAPAASTSAGASGASDTMAAAALCCYAPRLMEGLLVSIGRMDPAREKMLAATICTLGAECTKELTRSHTHLVVGAAEGSRLDFARQHNICVVAPEWVDEMARLGMPLGEKFFPVGRSAPRGLPQ